MKHEHDDLNRYLNGELDRKNLPQSLQREAAAYDRILGTLGRERLTLPDSVRSAVMKRVRVAAQSPWRRMWGWVTTPRLSPLTGALVAAAVLVAIWLRPGGTESPETATTRFVFLAPAAHHVAITGDWVHWDPTGIPLNSPRGDGVWTAAVAIPPGLHHYVFVIDGTEWRPDPNATSQVDDGFGRQNSVLLVPAARKS